jgi:polar amino acid transport system permease protein
MWNRLDWDWDYTMQFLPHMFSALKVTIAVTFASFAVALIGGLLLAMLRRARYKGIAYLAGAFVEFIRSTPLIVQAFFIFYVFPISFNLVLSPFTAGVIALGIHYSTYLSEVYRSGIDAVDKGQWEAAKALNFSRMQTWMRIILPQAIPPLIPVLGNYLIVMFKETPILSAITLMEIMGVAKQFGSASWRFLEPVTMVGLLFLLLSYPSSLLVRYAETRLNRQRGS